MVMGGLDVVDAARRCAGRLQDLGLTGWSQSLVEAVESASTGGELVMAVRWQLQQLERSGEHLPEDVRHLLREILQEINRTGW
jgi:hypothetical protein